MEGASTKQATRPDTVTRIADVVSVASDFGVVWVALSVAQVVLRRQSARRASLRLASAGAASLALTRVLKHQFAVPRETEGSGATLARTPSSPSFPSGHTLAAFTSAVTIPRSSRGRLAALGFATLVAWSRVRVGHHRPADVVAGAWVGTLAGGVLRVLLGPASVAG